MIYYTQTKPRSLHRSFMCKCVVCAGDVRRVKPFDQLVTFFLHNIRKYTVVSNRRFRWWTLKILHGEKRTLTGCLISLGRPASSLMPGGVSCACTRGAFTIFCVS